MNASYFFIFNVCPKQKPWNQAKTVQCNNLRQDTQTKGHINRVFIQQLMTTDKSTDTNRHTDSDTDGQRPTDRKWLSTNIMMRDTSQTYFVGSKWYTSSAASTELSLAIRTDAAAAIGKLGFVADPTDGRVALLLRILLGFFPDLLHLILIHLKLLVQLPVKRKMNQCLCCLVVGETFKDWSEVSWFFIITCEVDSRVWIGCLWIRVCVVKVMGHIKCNMQKM